MVGCNAIVADTEDEARRLFTTPQQQFTRMVRGTRGQLPPPVDDIETFWSPMEKAQASSNAGLLVLRLNGDDQGQARTADRGYRRRRTDGRRGNLGSPGAGAFLRAAGPGDGLKRHYQKNVGTPQIPGCHPLTPSRPYF